MKELKAFRYTKRFGYETTYSGPVEIIARNASAVLLRITSGEQSDEEWLIRANEKELAKFIR